MVNELFAALAAGLKIWEHKDANKYRDRLFSLKREYYEEFNKPLDKRNDAVLDNCEFELRLLASGFASSVGA